jgi:hypothetical protein
MTDLQIDRLSLKVPGKDAQTGRRLAEQISAALARMPMAGRLPVRADHIRVAVNAGSATTPSRLAVEIAAGIMRELSRT